MSKHIIEMLSWTPLTYNNVLVLDGTVVYHPKLGSYIHVSYTSEIIDIKLTKDDNNVDIVVCESLNSIYRCPVKFLKLGNRIIKLNDSLGQEAKKLETIYNKLLAFNSNEDEKDNELETILSLMAQRRKELASIKESRNNKILEIVAKNKDTIYMDISQIHSGDNIAYRLGDECSILKSEEMKTNDKGLNEITYRNKSIHLSYEIKTYGFDIIKLSSNIHKVMIHNSKKTSIIVNDIEIKAEETKTIPRRKLIGLFRK